MVDWGRIGLGAATFGMSEGGGLRSALGAAGINPLADPGADQERERRRLLYEQAQKSGSFADTAQGTYGQLGGEASAQRDYLRRLASGEDSLSRTQLGQDLQRNQAAQMSMAAGASPQNAASTARLGAILASRQASGMSGAAALAGVQERQAAHQGLANMILQQRGQDLNAALQARQSANAGYGAYTTPMTPERSDLDKLLPVGLGLTQAIAMSDRRVKKGIRRGDREANEAIRGLRAYVYKYKDARHGEGEHTGIMTDDLKRAGLGHTIIKTPEGEAVHGAKAATSALGLVAALGRRVERLEGRR